MAYLLTQILACLALAMIAGAAIGWLINGYRAARRERKIKSELMRQSLALNQAETDNRMIEEDYKELKQQSEETLSLYREENKQIPVLNQNLEKSQSLVRQLIQKHELEVRNLQQESDRYNTRLRELENREKAVTRLQMELNTTRLNSQGYQSDTDELSVAEDQSSLDQANEASTDAVIETLLVQKEAQLKQAEMQLDALDTNFEADSSIDEPDPDELADSSTGHVDAGNQLDSSYDELTDTVDAFLASNSAGQPSMQKSQLDELSQLAKEADEALAGEDIAGHTGAQSAEPADAHTQAASPATTSAENSESSLPSYGAFGTSERRDKLQEIFGIGPVTENTLISLGITSYEQIAALGSDEIDQVAAALDIFPGRIVRDNWVESAKKLLATENEKQSVADDLHELEDA